MTTNKKHEPNLKTSFCHKCGKLMYYPYQSVKDGELYHNYCLPENEENQEDKDSDNETGNN